MSSQILQAARQAQAQASMPVAARECFCGTGPESTAIGCDWSCVDRQGWPFSVTRFPLFSYPLGFALIPGPSSMAGAVFLGIETSLDPGHLQGKNGFHLCVARTIRAMLLQHVANGAVWPPATTWHWPGADMP